MDCHTHIVFGGNRAREFELRLEGASYEEVARAGGGIVSTVTATRAASEDELVADALPHVDALLAEGVTTIEIKSGYGLDIETELRMLRAARRIGRERPIRVRTSFLGAHAVPAEYKNRPDAYIDEICLPALTKAAEEGLADAVDGFCEGIAFSRAQTLRDAGVPMAIATDCNPGSSPLTSLLLAMNMACTLFRMTPEEALAGATRIAAQALGLADAGTIDAGKRSDLAIWNVSEPAELAYRIGFNPLHKRIFAGTS